MKVFTYIMMVGALCCLFCYSKEKEDAPTGATFNKTFVTGYLTPESIVISKMNSGIKITFKGDLITSGRSFDALSIYYNDLSYKETTHRNDSKIPLFALSISEFSNMVR